MSALEGLLAAGLLTAAAWFGIDWYGTERFHAGRTTAIAERAAADAQAVRARNEKNSAEAVRQVVSNATITEKKHEEVQPVHDRIVTQRVYVGTAVCGDGPAVFTEAQGAASGDDANPSGRLVRPDVERDLIALKLAVEEDLATGRACQALLKDEGLAP